MPTPSLHRALDGPKQPFNYPVALCLLVVFALQLLYVARLYSANWDEAHHLYDGYRILTLHDYRANAEVPPLVKVAAALPLLRLHPQMPPHLGDSQVQSAFLEGRAFVFGNGGDRVLSSARMVCMLFSLLAAVLVYMAARSMFGTGAALCALLLFVFDPLILAHGTLVSTDVASAAFLFGAVYAFFRYCTNPGWGTLLVVGLAAGLALAAKFTGILVVPILLLLAVVEGIAARSGRVLARRLGACVLAVVCAWGLLWAFYGFRYAPAPPGLSLAPPLGSYLSTLPNPSDGVKLAWMAKHRLLPEAYVWGLANTKHTEWEYTSYFWGKVHRHGPWQYFPAAFLIKSTLALLLLLVLSALLRPGSGHRRALVFLLVPVAVYFAVITSSHFDIGARHMMPVYPFLYVLAGATAARMLNKRGVWAGLAVLLLSAQVVTSLRVAPNFMAYGNEAWGGPLQVRRYLSDANVDWGQQLKTAKAYLDARHPANCWIAYFPDGAVQPADYGVPCRRLPTPSGLWWFGLPMDVPPVIDGTVLISESVLDGVESGDGVLNPYESFHAQHPVAILQDGLYVYQGTFAVPLASAWVQIRRSGVLAQAGHPAEALKAAREAEALAPDSPRTQLQLAEMLAASGQWSEAAAHYRLASGYLRKQRPDLQGDELQPRILSGLDKALQHTQPAFAPEKQ